MCIRDSPGAKAAFGSDAQFTSTYNPLIDLNDGNYTNETKLYRLMGNFYLRANIIKGLKFTTTFSPNSSHKRQGIFYATGLNLSLIHISRTPGANCHDPCRICNSREG